MSVTVILDVTAKPGSSAALIDMFSENFKQTRVREGCREVAMSQGHEDANQIIIVMDWDTRSHYESYLQWRADTGAVEKLNSLITGDISINYFDRLDA